MHVQHHRNIRLRKARQRLDLPRMVGAHFIDGERVPSRRSRQRQRHAQVIVQAARGGEGIVQGGAQEGLGRGFAAAAGDGHHLAAQAPSGGTAQVPQGIQRVRHLDAGAGGVHRGVYQCAGRSRVEGGGHEVVAVAGGAMAHVEAWPKVARQGDEEIARTQCARVDAHASEVRAIGRRGPHRRPQVGPLPKWRHFLAHARMLARR